MAFIVIDAVVLEKKRAWRPTKRFMNLNCGPQMQRLSHLDIDVVSQELPSKKKTKK